MKTLFSTFIALYSMGWLALADRATEGGAGFKNLRRKSTETSNSQKLAPYEGVTDDVADGQDATEESQVWWNRQIERLGSMYIEDPTPTVIIGDLSGKTLAPGLHYSPAAIGLTGDVFLETSNNPNARFRFRCDGGLAIAAGVDVVILNDGVPGGLPSDNVVWDIGGAATIGAGSTVIGTVNAIGAINLGAGVTVLGALTSANGAVALGADSEVDGAITAFGAVTLGAGSTGAGAMKSKSGAVTFGAGADGRSTIEAEGAIALGASASSGDLVSTSGSITLGAGSTVYGSVSAPRGVITFGAEARVNVEREGEDAPADDCAFRRSLSQSNPGNRTTLSMPRTGRKEPRSQSTEITERSTSQKLAPHEGMKDDVTDEQDASDKSDGKETRNLVHNTNSITTPWTIPITRKASPQVYLYDTQPLPLSEYGIRMTANDKEQEQAIHDQFITRLCSDESSTVMNDKALNKGQKRSKVCAKELEILKCISCSLDTGTWYSAVSQAGAVFGRVGESLHVDFHQDNAGFGHKSLDIAVPVSGEDEKLRLFAARLGASIKTFRQATYGNEVHIRLLVTRYPGDQFPSTDEAELFRKELATNAFLNGIGSVLLVDVTSLNFSRAQALNALHQHACHDEDCVVAAIDVDMDVNPTFMRNALSFAQPGASAYFPIVWSEFNPETVRLAEAFSSNHGAVLSTFSPHKGLWRKYGFGMYAISGSDAANFSMDEGRFIGWGGEDTDFYSSVSKKLNIVRMQEHGLIHLWHPKNCELGSFVETSFFQACVGSKAAVEGSPLGMYLQSLKAQDELQFTTLMTDVAGTLTSKEEAKKQVQLHPSPQVKTADVVQSAQEKASISIAVTPQSLVKTVDAVQSAAQEKALILIAVVTSRDMLESRVAAIASSWAQEGQVPDDIEIKFFVGASSDRDSVLVDGSLEDRAAIAKYAGLLDRSAIVVMPEVVDDEYPPVYKNSAMIKHLERIAAAKDQENGNSYEWIYKVDDDTYVNIHALRQFVDSKSAKEFQFLGQKGTGKREDKEGLIKEGLVKPYCMGGPGYILSRSTLQETARGIDSCVEHAESSPMRHSLWHSDVVIGMCVYRKMGIGCWDGDDYYSQKQKFTHNFKGLENYVADADLVEAVSMHPFKEPGSMLLQHQRYSTLFQYSTLSPRPLQIASMVNSINNTERPLFILHIGPHKTGTTTLQCLAGMHEDKLREDNFYFLGTSRCGEHSTILQEVRRLAMCGKGGNYKDEKNCQSKWDELLLKVRHHHAQNHNVIMSEELIAHVLGFSREKSINAPIVEFLSQIRRDWQIRVIATYRRFHNREVSLYSQNFEYGNENEPNFQTWPSDDIPSFPTYYTRTLRDMNNTYSAHTFSSILQSWQGFFQDVRVFNMHGHYDELGHGFFCQMLPEAPRLCEALAANGMNLVENTASGKSPVVIIADRLAVAAYHRGWLDKTLPRHLVREAATSYLETYPTEDFPLECLSATEAVEFLEKSLQMESAILPEFFKSHPKGEAELRSGFANDLKNHKFCSVDVNLVLDNDINLLNFFTTLGSEVVVPQ